MIYGKKNGLQVSNKIRIFWRKIGSESLRIKAKLKK